MDNAIHIRILTAFPPLVIRGRFFCALVQLAALRSAQLLPVSISSPPIVAGFLLPIPCGGFGGFLNGLFYGGIIFHLPILSTCAGLLVPSRHRRRTIPLM